MAVDARTGLELNAAPDVVNVGPLVTLAELRIWTRDPSIADDDQFALVIIDAASEKVRAAAWQPAWEKATAPSRALQIAGHLAARSFLNPDSIATEGAIGPLGGDRIVEEMAKALHLTAAEVSELEGMRPEHVGAAGSLWIQPINGGTAEAGGDVYLADDSGSDWMIPYLAEDDIQALG